MAPDDIDDADTMIRGHDGFENDQHGRVIAKAFRGLKQLAVAVRDLERRVSALENPGPPPPQK
jgi:hypothetical protein